MLNKDGQRFGPMRSRPDPHALGVRFRLLGRLNNSLGGWHKSFQLRIQLCQKTPTPRSHDSRECVSWGSPHTSRYTVSCLTDSSLVFITPVAVPLKSAMNLLQFTKSPSLSESSWVLLHQHGSLTNDIAFGVVLCHD